MPEDVHVAKKVPKEKKVPEDVTKKVPKEKKGPEDVMRKRIASCTLQISNPGGRVMLGAMSSSSCLEEDMEKSFQM